MKKKNLNSLKLNKKSISNFNSSKIMGADSSRADSRDFKCATLQVTGCVYETAGACTSVGPLCLP